MSYSNPMTCMYNFPNMDFGGTSGATTHNIAGPAGKKGWLREVGVVATEVFACDATDPHVQVGIVGDLDEYAKLNIADGTADNATFNSSDDTDAIIDAAISADTTVVVTLTEGTDGATVTGQGYPYVIIDWY